MSLPRMHPIALFRSSLQAQEQQVESGELQLSPVVLRAAGTDSVHQPWIDEVDQPPWNGYNPPPP
ncbi:hypothetical protein BA78_8893 [Aspergillus fumigatus]|nr:hypothetical protein BA78_8893 [Aspergillus fumigatus]